MVEYIRYCWENASRLFKMPAIKFADILEILLIAFVVIRYLNGWQEQEQKFLLEYLFI